MELNKIVTEAFDSGVKAAKDIKDTLFKIQSVENLRLFRIGKPSGFSKRVDPDSRIKWYMESKMNVIDIIPCDYMIPLNKALETFGEEGTKTDIVDALTPHISYGAAVKEYQKICGLYGLEEGYGGLRLYLTDETTSTDDFTNTYTPNIIDTGFNKLRDMTKWAREIGRSVSSNYDEASRKYGRIGGEKAAELAGTAVDFATGLAGFDTELASKLKILGGAVGEAIAAGNKISWPKLWSDSTYTPNISAVVKLVSPYGHPDAIKEFIIKPLMHLLIMAAPRTGDGISYGHTPKITLKGYGMAHLPLAQISNINLRKGGADTSYNIYRQPLSVDVSLQFQSLVDGFAVFDKESIMHKSTYTDSEKITLDINTARGGKLTFFPTLGTIVDSLRPVAINKIVTKHNIQDLPFTPGLGNIAQGDAPTSAGMQAAISRRDTPTGGEDMIASSINANNTKQSDETVLKEHDSLNDQDSESSNRDKLQVGRA